MLAAHPENSAIVLPRFVKNRHSMTQKAVFIPNVEFVKNLFSVVIKTYSLETLIDDEGKLTLEDILPNTSFEEPLSAYEHVKRVEEIASWLDALTNDEKKVITMRYGLDDEEPQTLEAIGKIFGVTRERIRQIEQKAINKLRKTVKRKNIERENI